MIELRRLDATTLTDLPGGCPGCTFWAGMPAAHLGAASEPTADSVAIKRDWVNRVTRNWGPPGWVAYLDGVQAGHVEYAPREFVAGLDRFPSGPVSPDALVLCTLSVTPESVAPGRLPEIQRRLIAATVKDTIGHRFHAVEAFAARGPRSPWQRAGHCQPAARALREGGFRIIAEHPTTPRLRLDTATVVTWRDRLDAASERLLGGLRRPIQPIPTPMTDAGDR